MREIITLIEQGRLEEAEAAIAAAGRSGLSGEDRQIVARTLARAKERVAPEATQPKAPAPKRAVKPKTTK